MFHKIKKRHSIINAHYLVSFITPPGKLPSIKEEEAVVHSVLDEATKQIGASYEIHSEALTSDELVMYDSDMNGDNKPINILNVSVGLNADVEGDVPVNIYAKLLNMFTDHVAQSNANEDYLMVYQSFPDINFKSVVV